MALISKIYRNFYTKIIRDPIAELAAQTKGCKTLLDIGCGTSSPVQFCDKNIYKVGVDGFMPAIKESRKKKIHNKYHHMDIKDLHKIFKDKSFDCVIAFDVIEHFPRKEGMRLIEEMERIAKKKVIIFTPNGFLRQPALYGNSFQEHKSGWSWREMEKRGYRVIGMNGWKPLRGALSLPRYKPAFLWERISDLTQVVVRHIPKRAFHIFCVKIIKK